MKNIFKNQRSKEPEKKIVKICYKNWKRKIPNHLKHLKETEKKWQKSEKESLSKFEQFVRNPDKSERKSKEMWTIFYILI